MRTRLHVLAILLAATTLTVAGWLYWALWRPLGNPAQEIEVGSGLTARQVLDLLSARGLVPSRTAARLYLAARGEDAGFRFGYYAIPADVSPVHVMERILAGRVETVSVTVVEGSLADDIGAQCAAAGLGTAEDWRAVIAGPHLISDLAPGATSLEGFLFPDTYRFAVGLSAEAAARHMIARFRDVWEEETREGPAPWGSPTQVVTLASLVEAETSLPDERPLIAGVFRNRLERGMLLQCDPTVVYALKRHDRWRGALARRDLAVDDPYNTYRYPGLPPGPINCPGRAAIAAALDPTPSSFLYFVARPGGGHTFSRTLREHNRAVQVLRRAGR
jgi:UPF0755 protein